MAEGSGTPVLPSFATSTPGVTLADSATSSLQRICVGIALEFPPGKKSPLLISIQSPQYMRVSLGDIEITPEEKEEGTTVMMCKVRGCETGWVREICQMFSPVLNF